MLFTLQQIHTISIHTQHHKQKMASTKTQLSFSCLLLTLFFTIATSANNGGAPAPAVDCSTLILEMADCLSYVTAGGTASKPVKSCCTGLKKVLKTDAECLCETFRNSAQLGITLNMTKAMNLPSACHVSAPSVTNCGLSVGTGAAPGLSPMLAPTSSVAGAPTTGVSGVEAAPAPAPTSGLGSSGSSTLATELFVFSTLLAAVSLAFF